MSVRFSRAASIIVVVAIAALASSCATMNSSARANAQLSSPLAGYDAAPGTNPLTAYEAVERVRPTFLRAGGGSDFQTTVYLDGMRIGDVSELHFISAASLEQIRFLSASEATAIFGTGGRYGRAIVLTSRKFGP